MIKSIKQIREKYGYTQEQLAELLDISVSTVRSWEQGQRRVGRRSKKDIKALWPTDKEVFEMLEGK